MNRTRVLWRRSATAGVAALALAGLVACGSGKAGSSGGSGGSGTSTDDLSKGDKVTKSQVSDIMTKAMDFDTAHMTMSTKAAASGQSVTMNGQGDIQAKPVAEHMTMKMSGPMKINAEIIFVDSTIYMKGMMGDGWVKMTADQLAKTGGANLSSMTNPLEMVKKMSSSVKSATYEGSEKVDGEDADHYKLTVDSAALTSALGTSSGDVTSGLPKTIDEDIWVDGDDHLRKSQIKMGTLGTTDVTLSDYGKKVDIKAPPANQVKQAPTTAG